MSNVTGTGTSAGIFNSLGGIFVIVPLLFGGRPLGLAGFGVCFTWKYCFIPPSPTHAFAVFASNVFNGGAIVWYRGGRRWEEVGGDAHLHVRSQNRGPRAFTKCRATWYVYACVHETEVPKQREGGCINSHSGDRDISIFLASGFDCLKKCLVWGTSSQRGTVCASFQLQKWSMGRDIAVLVCKTLQVP